MIYNGYKNFSRLRRKFKNRKIVFCTGVFDLTHAGHILFFESCKKFGDFLVVGVGNDLTIRNYKGKNRPIFNEHVRSKMVDSLRAVDATVLDEATLKDHSLNMIEVAFKLLKPDAYVVNKDGFDLKSRKILAKKYNILMHVLDRKCPAKFKNISTSSAIEKIKKDL